ncbi:MAG: Maf family protein [Candidatus Omnitrophica bacterium]|nr:Maf family protein [Candidatus Omnitrophota bacterium]MBU1524582.1 Maf family protein [Candidatus Omnitrophota bacterium]MBU2437284.1 Maf family protein [Candidatus Omnitrophota bacterium]
MSTPRQADITCSRHFLRDGFAEIIYERLSRKKIDKFVNVAINCDKAGGFSIEGRGAFIFDNIEGSFYNILGLPMMKLNELFEKLGAPLL